MPGVYPIDPTTGRPIKRPIYHYEGEPICFVQAYPLRDEVEFVEDAVKAQLNQAVLPEKVRDIIIGTERNCGANGTWTRWQQGFTPKEHREMLDRQRLQEFQTKREDDWQRFQAQMVLDEKNWKKEQEGKAEERHIAAMETMRGINRTQMLIMGGLVTVAIVVSTLVGAAIQAGWITKWFGWGSS